MATSSDRSSRDMVHLLEEVDRYRTATEDALQQLDWCIGDFVGCNKQSIARALGANRSQIRRQIRRQAQEMPDGDSRNSKGRTG